MAMTLVSTITVGSGGSSAIQWTSLPSTATDLCVIVNGKDTAANVNFFLTFNNSSSSYYWTSIRGTSTTSGSSGPTSYINATGLSDATNVFGFAKIYVANYRGSNQKSVFIESSAEAFSSSAYLGSVAGRWASTDAITSLKLVTQGGTWSEGSSASLYSITKGSGGGTLS